MTWLLIAGGLVFVAALVFVWALCAAAAGADRVSERALDRDEDGQLLIVDELHRHAKRGSDADTPSRMTEDR